MNGHFMSPTNKMPYTYPPTTRDEQRTGASWIFWYAAPNTVNGLQSMNRDISRARFRSSPFTAVRRFWKRRFASLTYSVANVVCRRARNRDTQQRRMNRERNTCDGLATQAGRYVLLIHSYSFRHSCTLHPHQATLEASVYQLEIHGGKRCTQMHWNRKRNAVFIYNHSCDGDGLMTQEVKHVLLVRRSLF